VCKVRNVSRVHVYSRDESRRTAFAAEMARTCQAEVVPVTRPEEAARGLDIIITITTSREPVLAGAWVEEGAHLNLAGSNFLAKTETDVEVFRRASLIAVDSREQARLEAGDFVAPLREGILHWSDVYELSHILTGRYPGREAAADVTLFKSLGLGIEDVAVATRVVELARQKGVGMELPI
jgi:ornithine cyclodeaminase/alanine dehydrogenase-like protein (mu-crystallin family)